MKHAKFFAVVFTGFVLTLATQAGAQNAVISWDAIAATTIVTNAKQLPQVSSVYLAYVHLAVFDAANAIDHRFTPYLFAGQAPAGASQDAAAAAAAHRVLVNYFPAQQVNLDAQLASSLAAMSGTPAEIADGVATGEAAAQTLIAARANDGLFASVPYSPPVGPGFWLPTPPAFAAPVTPWLGQMTPFTMSTAAQFFPEDGPTPLASQDWIDDYNQVKALGDLNSTVRTPQQTEIGLFWTENQAQQYSRAFRNLATQRGLSTSDTARLTAMLWSGIADSLIGCWNAKFAFSFWRPITAIRAGGGNPNLQADAAWTPLAVTPAHPEFPSAHACAAGSVSMILANFFGTSELQFSVDSLVTQTVHNYSNTQDLVDEVENARIFAGVHYHNSVVQGRRLGENVGRQLSSQFFLQQH